MGPGAKDDLPVEWVHDDVHELRDRPRSPRSGGWWPGWLLLIAAALVISVVAALLLGGHHHEPPGPTATVAPKTTNPTEVTKPPSIAAPVVVTNIGRPLLDVPAGWELFGRGSELVRIQLRAGRVTRTAVPTLQSTGPVSFIVGPDRAIIRPLDLVPGYVVPDGQAATLLTGLLDQGGFAFAGPDRNHLWILSGSNTQPQFEVVGFDGTPTNVSIPVPTGGFAEGSDGAGHVLVSKAGVTYTAGPLGLSPVTTGQLLAAGPTRWLAVECGPQLGCNTVVIDRASGTRRSLGPASAPASDTSGFPQGVVSPDGTTAAFIADTPTGPVLHLVDLSSGQDHRTAARLLSPIVEPEETMVWSPDGRTLFFVDPAGHLNFIDRAGSHINDLGVELPPIKQLALRVAAPSGAP